MLLLVFFLSTPSQIKPSHSDDRTPARLKSFSNPALVSACQRDGATLNLDL